MRRFKELGSLRHWHFFPDTAARRQKKPEKYERGSSMPRNERSMEDRDRSRGEANPIRRSCLSMG